MIVFQKNWCNVKNWPMFYLEYNTIKLIQGIYKLQKNKNRNKMIIKTDRKLVNFYLRKEMTTFWAVYNLFKTSEFFWYFIKGSATTLRWKVWARLGSSGELTQSHFTLMRHRLAIVALRAPLIFVVVKVN